MVRKALDTDFGRMLKEDRILKLIAKCDSAVVNGEKTVAESLEEVREESYAHVRSPGVRALLPLLGVTGSSSNMTCICLRKDFLMSSCCGSEYF